MIQSQYSTVAELDDETVDSESSESEEENLSIDIQSVNLEEIKNEKIALNKYQEFHCYAADKYLKQAKPVLENFRFSFPKCFI